MLQQYKCSWRKFLFYVSQKVICIFSKKLFVGLFVYLYITHSLLMHPKSIFSVSSFIHIPHNSIYFCYGFFCWTWYSRQGHTIDLYNIIIHLITFLYLCLQVFCFYKWSHVFNTHEALSTSALILTDRIPSWMNKATLDFWCFYEYFFFHTSFQYFFFYEFFFSFFNLLFINPEKEVWWHIQRLY